MGPTTTEHHSILSGSPPPPTPSLSSPSGTERSSTRASSAPSSSPPGTGRSSTWSLTITEHQKNLSEPPEPETSRIKNNSEKQIDSPPIALLNIRNKKKQYMC